MSERAVVLVKRAKPQADNKISWIFFSIEAKKSPNENKAKKNRGFRHFFCCCSAFDVVSASCPEKWND